VWATAWSLVALGGQGTAAALASYDLRASCGFPGNPIGPAPCEGREMYRHLLQPATLGCLTDMTRALKYIRGFKRKALNCVSI
jgi:hypothetical protein